MASSDIIIKGARVHNLKNISLTLPRDTPFSALPVGAAGFLVVLPGDA